MTAVKKTIAAGLAALTLGTATIATSSPAEAWWRYGWGAPVAAGVLGGLAAGAIIGSAVRPYAYGPYGYGPYGAPCVRRRPVYDGYGNFAGYRPGRVAAARPARPQRTGPGRRAPSQPPDELGRPDFTSAPRQRDPPVRAPPEGLRRFRRAARASGRAASLIGRAACRPPYR